MVICRSQTVLRYILVAPLMECVDTIHLKTREVVWVGLSLLLPSPWTWCFHFVQKVLDVVQWHLVGWQGMGKIVVQIQDILKRGFFSRCTHYLSVNFAWKFRYTWEVHICGWHKSVKFRGALGFRWRYGLEVPFSKLNADIENQLGT